MFIRLIQRKIRRQINAGAFLLIMKLRIGHARLILCQICYYNQAASWCCSSCVQFISYQARQEQVICWTLQKKRIFWKNVLCHKGTKTNYSLTPSVILCFIKTVFFMKNQTFFFFLNLAISTCILHVIYVWLFRIDSFW